MVKICKLIYIHYNIDDRTKEEVISDKCGCWWFYENGLSRHTVWKSILLWKIPQSVSSIESPPVMQGAFILIYIKIYIYILICIELKI